MAKLKKLYQETLVKQLMKTLKLENTMAVPRLLKITLNMGVGEAVNDKKIIDNAVRDLTVISGQKPLVTRAKKSVAGFKIREGWPIGCKVTLRGGRMYDFLERFMFIAIPRIRDFRGFSKRSFDGRGNYSVGIKEQLVFPEIQYDKIDTIRGLDITFSTNARTDEAGLALMQAFNFPFKE